MPFAPPIAARAAFEAKVQMPRETSAILPASESLTIVPRLPFGSVAEPQRCVSTGLPSVPSDASRRRRAAGRCSTKRSGAWRRRRPGSARRRVTAARRSTVSAGAKTCEFDVAATEIASGAVPGEPARAEAEVLAVVAGGDHRDDAGERGVVHRFVHRVVRRVGLRPAAREVDDVHPVRDGRLEGAARSPACSPGDRAASAP